MTDKIPMKDTSDLRAAAALFAIEEVGDLLDKLDAVRGELKAEVRAETRSAVLHGMKGLSKKQELIINDALDRLKIRASLVEPTQFTLGWLLISAMTALLAGVLIGLFIGKII
jgi:hypothetical protein